jgi:cell division protein FtsI (penicillin-binding protein 3)
MKPVLRITRQIVNQNFPQRIRLVQWMILSVVLLILLRSAYLQLIQYSEFNQVAAQQIARSRSVTVQRGTIADSQGNLVTASLPLYSLYAAPDQIEDPAAIAFYLSEILHIPVETLEKKLSGKSSFTWIRRYLPVSLKDLISSENFKGLHFIREYKRVYPGRNFSPQLIGFAGIDSKGLEGIEYEYDAHLMGRTPADSFWSQIWESNVEPAQGGSIKLTIQPQIQYYTDKELRNAYQKMEAESAIAMVMEVATGKILAMSTIPDFDANQFERYSPKRYFNQAIGFTYEPGSTFKIITLATALHYNVIQPDQTFFCENGSYEILDRTIHDTHPHGDLDIRGILKKSSNICAAKIGQLIPKPMFYKMIRDFGFGSKTDVGLPGEQTGKLYHYNNWSEVDVATLSYGHSVSVTPLQIITAVNAVANKGVYLSPKVIEEMQDPNGQVLPLPAGKEKRLITEENAAHLTEYMKAVTEKGGTGYSARVDGVEVAGKTGTARKFDYNKGEYSTENHIVSFVGYLPADKPELSLLVVINDPKHKYLGSKSAAPVFSKIAERAIGFYRKAPQQFQPFQSNLTIEESSIFKSENRHLAFKQWKGLTMRDALKKASQLKQKVEISGSGKVVRIENGSEENTLRLVFK